MRILIFLTLTILSNSSFATTPLVTSAWLNENINKDNLVLLDLRPKDFFNYVHIPNSVHSDYNLWRQAKTKVLQKMLPSKQHLESLLSSLGITNDSHVIIISAGESANDLASATRVYWTLEQIGHKDKSILQGGIIDWASQRLPLTQTTAKKPQKSQYKIDKILPQASSITVAENIKQQDQIIDTRSIAEHNGIVQGAPDERAGTIESSLALPYDWLTVNQSGRFNHSKNLEKITQSIDLSPQKPTLVYCHTGHRASLSWFVLKELLGYNNVTLYDGSTRDWATQKNLPMTREINLEY